MWELKNKKVLVMGFGLHGGGRALSQWLVGQGAKVTVTDLKSAAQLEPSIAKLSPAVKRKITWVLGRHRIPDFKTADMIIQNPGVPTESEFLAIARESGVRIENDATLFFAHCPAPIIGVTGTRGKSTVSALIFLLLQKRFAGERKRVWLAGLPGKPEFGILSQVKHNHLVVLELSSWQLEMLGERKLSPHGAVVTTILPDHLNRYRSMDHYIRAKKNIFMYQRTDDFVALNYDDPVVRELGESVKGERLWFSVKRFAGSGGAFVEEGNIVTRHNGKEQVIANVHDLKLPGNHNLQNALAAAAIAGHYDIKMSQARAVFRTFKGLPSRLELVRKHHTVAYYNDTTATTPDATMAALATLSDGATKPRIILIAGGADKKVPVNKFQELSEMIARHCKAVILFAGEGSKKIKIPTTIRAARNVGSMEEAIRAARVFAEKGDIVLLSPACASFGMFTNEYDRGSQFTRLVNRL